MYGDLRADPAFDVWYGIIDPEWYFGDEEEEEEEEIPEWKHKSRRKPMVIKRRGNA